jgi:hypothetical protein
MKRGIQPGKRLRAGMLALAAFFLLPVASSAAVVYDVTVDTSSIAGTSGNLDFQFNPSGDAPAALATLSQFDLDGTILTGPPILDGDVSASPGTLSFGNGPGFNAALQPVTFGTSLSFRIAFAGDFLTEPSTAQTVFGILFWNTDLSEQLLEVGPKIGGSVEFQLLSGSVTGEVYPPGSITLVPEPATWVLLGAGVIVLMRLTGRKRAA